ncbi:hypothetical protein HCC61_16645 [Streptomyces sp. HNM0575]|uniref:hypothetical protein n=1 Tax=Streptomyces sp. HNM0575 TaxID=2716338 RepID=UPI00145E83D8|nr:hypothetical protein [Streptomyces sp. HNM0575]NLU74287.1 hypothetical protein [Streptomyces sp. HNM0575]
MGKTSFIVSRTAPAAVRDVLAEPRTQFAELTGAYWLEPIYAKLANEWDRQGRTVPGAPREHWRVPPDGSLPAEVPGRPAELAGPDADGAERPHWDGRDDRADGDERTGTGAELEVPE